MVGFACYSVSTVTLLTSKSVRSEYAHRHPLSPEPTTRLNDAAFGVHALLLCSITYSQFWPQLWGWKTQDVDLRNPTIITRGILSGVSIALIVTLILVLSGNGSVEAVEAAEAWGWLDLVCLRNSVASGCPVANKVEPAVLPTIYQVAGYFLQVPPASNLQLQAQVHNRLVSWAGPTRFCWRYSQPNPTYNRQCHASRLVRSTG